MPSRIYHISVDAADPAALGRFWAAALDYRVLIEDEDETVVGADPDTYPGLCFLAVPEEKAGKNRLHIDLVPDDRDAEVARLIALGAQRVDVGQGPDATWVVLADPEGNEFCVLRPKKSLTD
ncbi:VOC family protein [Catenulispora pinisilvae]|uniref:VOC family protein n=1 Tax=Catenulispora pinisilvae TaxID=2705253 RepID=UPI001891FD8E|nr:VOC family protein [Catenulispora pinisilvae]